MHAAPRAARSIALLTHPPPSPAQEAEPRRSQRAVRPEQAPPSPAPPDDAAGADQSHTCQSTEKRKRDEGAKLALTFSQIKWARRAQSRAGRPGQCRGRAPRVRGLAARRAEAAAPACSLPTPSCFGRSHTIRACLHYPRSGGELVTEVDGVQLYLSKQSATGVRGLESYPHPSNHTSLPPTRAYTPTSYTPTHLHPHTSAPPPEPPHTSAVSLPHRLPTGHPALFHPRPDPPPAHPRAPSNPHTPQPLHARCTLHALYSR